MSKSEYDIENEVLIASYADSMRPFEPSNPVPDGSRSRPAKQEAVLDSIFSTLCKDHLAKQTKKHDRLLAKVHAERIKYENQLADLLKRLIEQVPRCIKFAQDTLAFIKKVLKLIANSLVVLQDRREIRKFARLFANNQPSIERALAEAEAGFNHDAAAPLREE